MNIQEVAYEMLYAVIFWGVLFIIAAVTEFATQQLVSIWFVVGSLCAIVLAAFGCSEIVQVAVFLVVSLLLLIFTRPIVRKVFKFNLVDTNLKREIGKNAVVIQEIDTEKGTGRVRLEDSEWIAVSSQNLVIPKDSIVRVCAIDGAKLFVEPVKKANDKQITTNEAK